MSQNDIKNCFAQLGLFLNQFQKEGFVENPTVKNNDLYKDRFLNTIQQSQHYNGWFTPENVYFSIQSWAKALEIENLDQWLNKYDFKNTSPKTIGLILAGNIPLVGFHDFLCVLICGHKALIKLSSNDQILFQFLIEYLNNLNPEFENRIILTDGKLENFDAVIATGSNNTSRYFEYYFKNKPSIIRKNRNSIAILNGNESKEELILLGKDIFQYFGLGCRNVSKLFIPSNYSFDTFFEAMYEYRDIIEYEKYANNYDYNKAVYLMSNFKLLENGFLTLKEDPGYSSPISSLFYEFYNSEENLYQKIEEEKEQIQCIVSNSYPYKKIKFGETQTPSLWDYADNIDTISFLISLK